MEDDAVRCRVDADNGSQAGGRHPGQRPGQAVPEDHVPCVRHRDRRGHVTVCWIEPLNRVGAARPKRTCPHGVDHADFGVPEPVGSTPRAAACVGHCAGRRVDAAHIVHVGDPQRARAGNDRAAGARRKPSSRSDAPPWSSSGTCCPTPQPTTPTSDRASSTSGSTPNAASGPTSTSSKPSATKSPSNPPPD